MRIGMCPLGRLRSAADAAAALGQWIAARSPSPVLVVEASFDSPQAARFFRTRRLGLAEAMAAREPRWDHFVHDSVYSGLKVLPAGRNPAIKQLLADQTGFRSALDELDKLFDCVIVLLPNPRVTGMEKLLAGDSTDIVFPVIEPGRVTARQAAQARRKLAAGAARVAAALVSPGPAVGEATRMEHIAKQLGRASSVGDLDA
jgi:Mrp family chromosome partitioning ATPase